MQAAGDKAAYDSACKRLLSEKIILAWIMKECMPEYAEYTAEEIVKHCFWGNVEVSETAVLPDETNAPPLVSGGQNEDTLITEGTVRYDIRFRASAFGHQTCRPVRLIINLEAQKDYYPGYPLIKRGIYYGGRLLSAQYGTEFTKEEYDKLKKVYSIWICTEPPKYQRNTIMDFFIEKRSRVGTAREKKKNYEKKNYDLMTIVMINLGDPKEDAGEGIIKLLNTLLVSRASLEEKRRVLEEEFHIPFTQELKKEVSHMCNLGQGLEDRGRREGRRQGRREGRHEGRHEGWREAQLQAIRNIMETTGWTVEQAMDLLKISKKRRNGYKNMLEKS